MTGMLKYQRIGAAVSVALALTAMPAAHAQVAAAVGGLTTSATISQIFSGLDDLIVSAQDAGDYLSMRAAIEAKGVIETWKEANKELLDKAFSDLSETQRQTFNNARQLTERANQDIANRLEATQLLVNQANQLVESIPFSTSTYVTRYSPRVKPAQIKNAVTLRVNGVNLDKGDPVLTLNQGPAARMVVGPMEVLYTVPVTALQGEADKLAIVPLKLTYSAPKEGFWNQLSGTRETVERELPIVTLPSNLGHFSYVVETEGQQKVVEEWTSQKQKFKGKNKDVKKVVKPKAGWRWDWEQGVNAFKQAGAGGEAGKCNGISESESTADGIVHSAHLDEIKQGNPLNIKYGPGWQNCVVKGPIYQMVTVKAKLPAQAGALNWTEDLRLPIPQNFKSVQLEVTTFDGRKRIFTDSGADKFFDVIRGGSELIIRPRQPADL
ncbi:hypothetical protein [Cupriavidus sp. IK-TO18]|uniref:hypothetical protein n=1 Tax=Cupriavidus sp. IK-TO18 TaxID=2782182 RepID=UPI001899B30F|nr:hypothetical protein [Cupriavidus sp. IK-TO18]MBF6990786.1 hypothetical protein [Cupriavidus sp. IK-TO18]